MRYRRAKEAELRHALEQPKPRARMATRFKRGAAAIDAIGRIETPKIPQPRLRIDRWR